MSLDLFYVMPYVILYERCSSLCGYEYIAHNLIWLSTAISYWTFPLAGISDVVEIVHFACRDT